jgi:uncharacterized protein YlzI (FlbEa/FlbD family)
MNYITIVMKSGRKFIIHKSVHIIIDYRIQLLLDLSHN